MKSRKFQYLVLMTKYISKTMDRQITSWILELITKTVILINILKSFFEKHIVLIFLLLRTAFLLRILF